MTARGTRTSTGGPVRDGWGVRRFFRRARQATTLVAAGAFGLVLAGLSLPGCSDYAAGTFTPPNNTPVATTPLGALQVVQYAWTHLDTLRYARLFPTDYLYGSPDTVGGKVWDRAEELAFARHLFVTGETDPAERASAITWTFISVPVIEPDARPGRIFPWHRQAIGEIGVIVSTVSGITTTMSGPQAFYLVRGDSARITAEMQAAGMPADSNHWYVEEWDQLAGGRLPLLSTFRAAYR